MFRLNKHRSQKSGDRIEFKISHLKALQVPKGWDKLYVSVVNVENGKTIGKSSKVPVRNGDCQWSDTFSEYTWASRDNSSSKEMDDCILKLIVAMGSSLSRSGILGEATVNVTSYVNSDAATPLTILLNKCNHGTILKVSVQCLTPRRKLRHQESSETNSNLKVKNENNHDVAVESNGSEYSHVTHESSSIDDVDSIFSPEEVETPAASLSGSVSNCSYNSAEGSIGFGNLSPCISDDQSPMGRQDSTRSQKIVSHQEYPVNSSPQSNHSSFNSKNMKHIGKPFFKMTNNAPKNSQEAAEDTSEELRAEAKMWEMNARKVMGDFDELQTEFSDLSKKLAGLEMERDSLKKQVEQLKLSSGDSIVRQTALEDSISQGECIPKTENSIIDELKFQKESNANLSLQLKKSQDANVELVSILQELEGTIEQQKLEIENLSSLPSKLSTPEKSFQLSDKGNSSLMQQIEQLEESKKKLLFKVQELEEELEDKMRDIEHANFPNNKTLSDIEMEYKSKLSAKEEEISSLKARLLESLPETCKEETVSSNADLVKEIDVLKKKIRELELDCNELTDENVELLVKLKEAKNNSNDGGQSENILSKKLKDQPISSFEPEGKKLFRFHSEDMLQGENGNGHISIRENDNSKSVLNNELTNRTSEMENLMEMHSEMDSSIEVLKQKLKATQFHCSEAREECENLRGENQQLKITIENLSEECNSFEKLNRDLRQQKLELEEYCSLKETRLRESNERYADSSRKVELLEKKYALMLEDIESKEKNMTSDIDGVLDENRKHMEQGHRFLNQMQMEKMVEIENLKLEVENLSQKLSAAYTMQTQYEQKLKDLTAESDHVKKINNQHQQTIQKLELEKAEIQEKAQALEEELKLIKEQKRNKLNRKPVHDDQKSTKDTNQHRSNKKKPSSKNDRENLKDQQVENEHGLDESVHSVEVELEKAKDAKDIYEVQLNRSPSQGRNNQENGPVKSIGQGEELVTKEKFEHTKSILEAELFDLRERYFLMSIKYAEAEAEREELVMKLKDAKDAKDTKVTHTKKGWFK